jgi:hypothetical protein
MDLRCHRLAIVVALVLLALASEEVVAIRSPGVLAPRSSPSVSPAGQPGGRVDGNAAAGRYAAPPPEKKRTEAAGSAPSAVFDLDMSKRRVRRGSDPIHNKC